MSVALQRSKGTHHPEGFLGGGGFEYGGVLAIG